MLYGCWHPIETPNIKSKDKLVARCELEYYFLVTPIHQELNEVAGGSSGLLQTVIVNAPSGPGLMRERQRASKLAGVGAHRKI